jgi:hypothetical protein
MAEPAVDRRDVDKAKAAFSRLVITGGAAPRVFQFVEAPLNKVPQPIEFGSTATRSFRDSRIGSPGTALRASMVLRTLPVS